jgi:trehalose 6-phosphate phosphatase
LLHGKTTNHFYRQDNEQMFAGLGDIDPKRCCLFLDLDGTLIDIAPKPDGVSIPDDLVPLLGKLTAGLDGALAIITGRPISDIDRLLAPLRPAAAGVHGAELRMTADGTVSSIGRPIDLPITEQVADLENIAPGILVESKKFSIAVHYRQAPHTVRKIERALRSILRNGPEHLIISESRRVFEVVSDKISKGGAVEQFMRQPAFFSRIPIMIGDDSSDESALDAAMCVGGLGLRVAGEHFTMKAAEFGSPNDVRRWLGGIAERLGA